MSDERCRVRRASDGTRVRVWGSIEQDQLDDLVASARAYQASICKHIGPYEMPEVAQLIHDRRTYWCGLPVGHEGVHQWGARTWIGDEKN